MKCFVALLATAFIQSASLTVSAAPFENLDFEDAFPPDDLLLGWTTGGTDLGVGFEFVCLGSACVTVRGGLEGQYGLYLQSGLNNNAELTGVSVSQVGDVPIGAKSIRMLSTLDPGFPDSDQFLGWENLRVSLDGQDVPLQLLDTNGPVATIGGNLPNGFAGTTAELVVETIAVDDGIERWSDLDAISFSNRLVPEPSACLLIGLGALATLAHRFR